MASPIEQEFVLPPELWEQIFGHLRGKQLLLARQVCHQWRAIVDGKRTLWDRICIKFPNNIFPNGQFQPPESFLPATAARYEGNVIIDVRSWWPSFGEPLTTFHISHVQISLRTLLEMLCQMPNLVELGLLTVEYRSREEPEVDFRLEKLEKLQISSNLRDRDQNTKFVFKCFVQIFPNVKDLDVKVKECDQFITAKLIDSIQDTLKRLKLHGSTESILYSMSRMDRLQLKSFELGRESRSGLLYSHLRQLHSLEEINLLNASVTNMDLCVIVKNLPRLRHLATELCPMFFAFPTFLATMPQLEVLEIYGTREIDSIQPAINFEGFQSPKLTELILNTAHPIEDSLQCFLSGSRNLRRLSIIYCLLNSWSELLTIAATHSSLWYIALAKSHWDIPDIPTNSQLTNLEVLELSNCHNVTNEMIVHLCSQCPRLRLLFLASMEKLNNGTMEQLCRQLPQLARLRLERCCHVTSACAEHILDHCPALVYLGVNHCEGLLDAVRTLLKERGGCRYIELEDL